MDITIATNGKSNAASVSDAILLEPSATKEKNSSSGSDTPLGDASASVVDAEVVESKPKVKRSRSGANNKAKNFYLDIDAGAKRVKCRLNGSYKSFPSEMKEMKGDVPLRNDGCFSCGKKSYVVGRAIDRVNGELIVGSQNKKLSHLNLWVLGAITHYRKQMKDCTSSRRRKSQPAKINLYLRVVTLSSPQRKELDKMLKQISNFTWEDTDFEVTVKSCEFIDEGEGAAVAITRLYGNEIFHLIDLGGGTCSHSTYEWDGDELSTVAKTPVSGAGMTSIINKIFKALTRTDRGAIQAENSDIQEALELSRKKEDDSWEVPMRINGEMQNISSEVLGALSEWVGNNYALLKQFDYISQKLSRGESVYCSGGGFAVRIVADWILKYLSADIPGAKIQVLDEPQHVNLTGLKWLDVVEDSKDV